VPPDSGVSAVAHVIQLAVAPVFLLSGVGAMLAVLTNRLARIIDRARVLEERVPSLNLPDRSRIQLDLKVLSHRVRLINRAISLCTTSALLVCTVIAALFGGAFLATDVSSFIGFMFITAMLALIGALVLFLREIQIATRSVRIGLPHSLEPRDPPSWNHDSAS
jgi:hypothetical protein